MTTNDMTPNQPGEPEQTGQLFGEVFDLVDKAVEGITDAEIDNRLHQLLAGVGSVEPDDPLGLGRRPADDLSQKVTYLVTALTKGSSGTAERDRARLLRAAQEAMAAALAAAGAATSEAEAYAAAAEHAGQFRQQADKLTANADASVNEALDRAADALADVVVDLLATTFAEQLGCASAVPAETNRHALMLKIKAFIDTHLDDPDLSGQMIAAAHHISVRYLQKLFESEGYTVTNWIRTRRLERCRLDLADPKLSTLPVSAITARWGLTDASIFARMFKTAYGHTPREYRFSLQHSPTTT